MTTAPTTYDEPRRALTELLARHPSRHAIEEHLDALGPRARVSEVLALRGRSIKQLYHAAAGAAPIQLSDIVPADETGTVILEGRNSLPAFSGFQKRFCRVSDDVIVGYNHQTMAVVTGPGYFVVKPAEEAGEHPGEILFDYTELPPAEPDGWPAFVPNTRGLSRAVFQDLKDYCRRAARGVFVGRALKNGRDQNAYFVLAHVE
jgi:hypothetical protein